VATGGARRWQSRLNEYIGYTFRHLMKKICIILAIAGLSSFSALYGQKLDPSFHSPLPIRAAAISALVTQPDGKMLLAGEINFYGTERVHNLIRLNNDGSLDNTFSFESDDKFMITHLALLSSGEMFALARIFSIDGAVLENNAKILKIDASGIITREIYTQNDAWRFAVDQAGNVFTGGEHLLRYNGDLNADAEFNNNFSANGWITAIAANGDKTLVAGFFSEVNGEEKNDIVQLNADGTVDSGFDTQAGTNDWIGELTVQADGKILLGDSFINSFNGIQGHGMMRLLPDGSVDTDFNPPILNGSVGKIVVTEDGIYAAAFLQTDGEPKDRLFRVNVNTGELDATFPLVELDEFGSVGLQIAFINGALFLTNTQTHGNVFGLSKVTLNGVYDNSFAPEVSRFGTITVADVFHGKILVAGDFIRMDGIETYGIARLSLNGNLDETFRLKKNEGEVHQIKVLDSDNILVTTYKNFFKLDSQGNEKTDFSWSQFKYLYQVIKFEVLPDGKIMAGGPNLIYRLNSNGSEDPSFDVQSLCCSSSTAFDFDMQQKNVIYGSEFSDLGGVAVNRLARLTPQGAVDITFDPGAGPNQTISLIKVLKNGEVIVGGFYSEFDGRPVSLPIVKLSANGKVDDEFYNNLQSDAAALPYSMVWPRKVEQLGSKIYFQDINGIYVVTVDGKVDKHFKIPVVISAVKDIITFTDTQKGGRMKTDSAFLYTVGTFTINNSKSPSFILKMWIGQESDVTTATEQLAGETNAFKVEIYPLPVKDKVTLKVNHHAGKLHAVVSDLSGKKQMETTLTAVNGQQAFELDLQAAAPGFYLLKLTNDKGKNAFVKFVKVQ
jgi:uncharacterized delta-60 repeat protein